MLQVLLPIAGKAKAFADRGYTFPKPLIEIGSRSIIELVIRNIDAPSPAKFTFVCRKEDLQQYSLGEVISLLIKEPNIVSTVSETAGALCTSLLAVDVLDRNEELLIVNGDQFIKGGLSSFFTACRGDGVDGCILTFDAVHPRWSYAKVDENGRVIQVAEKRPISRNATAGLYYFRRAGDFITAAEQMLIKGLRTREQFFVCPVYNELILMGKNIRAQPLPIGAMWSLGTPEDVEHFRSSGIQPE